MGRGSRPIRGAAKESAAARALARLPHPPGGEAAQNLPKSSPPRAERPEGSDYAQSTNQCPALTPACSQIRGVLSADLRSRRILQILAERRKHSGKVKKEAVTGGSKHDQDLKKQPLPCCALMCYKLTPHGLKRWVTCQRLVVHTFVPAYTDAFLATAAIMYLTDHHSSHSPSTRLRHLSALFVLNGIHSDG